MPPLQARWGGFGAERNTFEDPASMTLSHLLGATPPKQRSAGNTLKVIKTKAPESLKVEGQVVPEDGGADGGGNGAATPASPQDEVKWEEAKDAFLKKLIKATKKAAAAKGELGKAFKVMSGDIGGRGADTPPPMGGGTEGGAAGLDPPAGTETVQGEAHCMEKQCVSTGPSGVMRCEQEKIPCGIGIGQAGAAMGGGTAGIPMMPISADKIIGAVARAMHGAGQASGRAPTGGIHVIRITPASPQGRETPPKEGSSDPATDGPGAPSTPIMPHLTNKQKELVAEKIKKAASAIEHKLENAKAALDKEIAANKKKEAADTTKAVQDAAKAAGGESSPSVPPTKIVKVVKALSPIAAEKHEEVDPAAVVSEADYNKEVNNGQKTYKKKMAQAHGTAPVSGQPVEVPADDKEIGQEILDLLKGT